MHILKIIEGEEQVYINPENISFFRYDKDTDQTMIVLNNAIFRTPNDVTKSIAKAITSSTNGSILYLT